MGINYGVKNPEHRETTYKGGRLPGMRWHSLPHIGGVTTKFHVYHIADCVDAAGIGGQLMSLSCFTGQAPGRSHQLIINGQKLGYSSIIDEVDNLPIEVQQKRKL